MEKRTFVGWIVVTVLLSSIVSFSIGQATVQPQQIHVAAQAIAQPSPPEQENPQMVRELLEKTNVGWRKTIDELAACNGQYSESTLLVTGADGQFGLSISPSTGHFSIQAQGDTHNIWVIPQHIRRVMTLNQSGTAFYYYTDLRTGKLDGPYVPMTATARTWAASQ